MTNSPQSAGSTLATLVSQAREARTPESGDETWPEGVWCLMHTQGVPNWFIPRPLGGQGCSSGFILDALLELGTVCLTSTFVLTQFAGAIRRIASMADISAAAGILQEIREGAFATVGISQLTTSRRHLGAPALSVASVSGGYQLNGVTPWVTGARRAKWIVTGAQFPEGQTSLFVVPTDAPGVDVESPLKLLALSGSETGGVRFEGVHVPAQWRIDPPGANLATTGNLAATGGLQTSALALGLARQALDFLEHQAAARPELNSVFDALGEEWTSLVHELRRIGEDGGAAGDPSELRGKANSFVLRTTHVALTAAKGAGFVAGHPAGRWCREALFFLVWSCPPEVARSHMCEFAGIAG